MKSVLVWLSDEGRLISLSIGASWNRSTFKLGKCPRGRESMKSIPAVVAVITLLLATPVFCETVSRIIESDARLFIDGREIHSPFTVILTDSNITVNGVEYKGDPKAMIHPVIIKEKPPIEETHYVDWLVGSVMEGATAMLAEGKDSLEIWRFMENFFKQNTDGSIVKITGQKGYYQIRSRHLSLPIHLSYPTRQGFIEQSQRETLKATYDELCSNLEKGFHIKNESGCVTTKTCSKSRTCSAKR
jgi:hypothetical protein